MPRRCRHRCRDDRERCRISAFWGIGEELIRLPDYAEIEAVGIIVLLYQALEFHRDTVKNGQHAVEILLSGQQFAVPVPAARQTRLF